MIITVLPQKIDEVKDERELGYPFIKYNNILNYLNTIIEWPWCEFPKVYTYDSETKEKKEKEIRNFLGDVPKLSSGNCFLYKGQVIAIGNKDILLLLTSETGPLALKRVLDADILPEIEIYYRTSEVDDLEWSEVTEEEAKINTDDVITPPYNYYKIWTEYFTDGRFDKDKKVFIKITISDEDFIFPITLYFTNKHTVLVRKRDFADKEHVISTIKKIIAWFINNESRKWSYIEEEKAKAKNNEQKHE